MSKPAYTDHLPGRTVMLEGEEFLYCSGTSYLGMACNKAFQQLVLEGMQRYGTNYSSSRRSNLRLQVYGQVEEQLTRISGAEAAVTMSSGFLMGQTLAQVLRNRGRFLYAPAAHPALWLDECAAGQANADITFSEWTDLVLEEVQASDKERFILICNALDPLKAESYTFDWVAQLPEQQKIILVVDDSHGFGVTGPEGAGIYPALSKYKNVDLVVVSSFGKALGVPAGFILASKEMVELVKASPYFGGASPAIPAYLHAYLQAGEVIKEARGRLQQNIHTFLGQVEQAEQLFRFIPDYPVYSTSHESMAAYLHQHRILISSFRYPTNESAPINRVILSSLHTPADLQRLAEAVNQFSAKFVIN
ncbi:aminotransferase class I/II-fold pyridoxal phosphate-dependent enzyme [Pontibacter anaerobius]|uniref:Aminotransferase class I/II-fold pyridoxal phosphate-dependent enzyme n=1 Tax=Pontibacter anaerobius TaxID=2993940 RepID=A0ABT3RFV7_9BACT|nr:aminotransferase class I/II-fold pyridoxal phosphate-dependent enzyme [Pontibacter anaerobius]MCX2740386.1 aminotransferase class I/II-fold pyridoxal phosphate-dependent enzyme [Pontibacter anaerobius]